METLKACALIAIILYFAVASYGVTKPRIVVNYGCEASNPER